MPMSWLWRDSKAPHGFYLIKLRKFQLKKRTVSFSRLQHFGIHSHRIWPHQLQRHLLLPLRSFPDSFIQDLALQYPQHNNLLKPNIEISQTLSLPFMKSLRKMHLFQFTNQSLTSAPQIRAFASESFKKNENQHLGLERSSMLEVILFSTSEIHELSCESTIKSLPSNSPKKPLKST